MYIFGMRQHVWWGSECLFTLDKRNVHSVGGLEHYVSLVFWRGGHAVFDALVPLQDADDRVGHFRQGKLLADADAWAAVEGNVSNIISMNLSDE